MSLFNNFNHAGQGGFVKIILLIVIILIVLGYFGFNISDIINSPTVKNNLIWARDMVVLVWDKYLKTPASWIWEKLLQLENVLKGKEGKEEEEIIPENNNFIDSTTPSGTEEEPAL